MKLFITTIIVFLSTISWSQNDLRLFSGNGKPFQVYFADSLLNAIPQANVLIREIKQDTLPLKIKFADSEIQTINLYLLNKGKRTTGKEFTYRVENESKKTRATFGGINDIIILPKNIVPVKPDEENNK